MEANITLTPIKRTTGNPITRRIFPFQLRKNQDVNFIEKVVYNRQTFLQQLLRSF